VRRLKVLFSAWCLLAPFIVSADAIYHVRSLAASCAACHGTDGNSVGGTPVLAGLGRSQFVSQMLAFRSGSVASSVMYHHAKGLTEQEIDQLADYFAAQPCVTAFSPSPLKGF